MSQAEQALIFATIAENAALKDRLLNIYLLSQDERRQYDTYDSCVVVAESEEEAVKIHPDSGNVVYNWWEDPMVQRCNHAWASHPNNVRVQCIGKADPSQEKGSILASFNAG